MNCYLHLPRGHQTPTNGAWKGSQGVLHPGARALDRHMVQSASTAMGLKPPSVLSRAIRIAPKQWCRAGALVSACSRMLLPSPAATPTMSLRCWSPQAIGPCCRCTREGMNGPAYLPSIETWIGDTWQDCRMCRKSTGF